MTLTAATITQSTSPMAQTAEVQIPSGLGGERCFAEELVQFESKFHHLWRATETTVPQLGETFSSAQQRENTRAVEGFSDDLEARLRALPTDASGRERWIQKLRPRLASFAGALGMPEEHREVVFSDDFFQVTSDFIHRARDFDRSLDLESLFQALRNVWVMNILRRMLGVEMACTSSVFAYSMLYPYTDNFLDDTTCDVSHKRRVSHWLGRRLRGELTAVEGDYEAAVSRLVGLIEEDYPRSRFPRVWGSILAIHHSQVKSLEQQVPKVAQGNDLLALSIAKGGSSVLADGYLVRGDLSRDQAEFIFGFGVVLQLLDDLQDIETDRAVGHRTIFTESPSPAATAGRLARFLDRVLDASPLLAMEHNRTVREIIRSNCRLLLINSVGFHEKAFPSTFARRLEAHAPLPFAFLRKRKGSTSKRFLKVRKVLHRRGIKSIFDIFP